jgi:hypothetical protein
MKIQNQILKYLNEILPKIVKPKSNHLGRWNNDCHLKTNKKIDFSNEDHCGPCGQLLKQNIKGQDNVHSK